GPGDDLAGAEVHYPGDGHRGEHAPLCVAQIIDALGHDTRSRRYQSDDINLDGLDLLLHARGTQQLDHGGRAGEIRESALYQHAILGHEFEETRTELLEARLPAQEKMADEAFVRQVARHAGCPGVATRCRSRTSSRMRPRCERTGENSMPFGRISTSKRRNSSGSS